MGYQTDFDGRFKCTPALEEKQVEILRVFAETRHGGPLNADEGMPSMYCQWVPSEDGEGIAWDGSEKFYGYTEWIQYLVTHFLKPWGVVLNGEVRWEGEETEDMGTIVVTDNVVTTRKAKVQW